MAAICCILFSLPPLCMLSSNVGSICSGKGCSSTAWLCTHQWWGPLKAQDHGSRPSVSGRVHTVAVTKELSHHWSLTLLMEGQMVCRVCHGLEFLTSLAGESALAWSPHLLHCSSGDLCGLPGGGPWFLLGTLQALWL